MSGCDAQKADGSKNSILLSTNSTDEGLPRELSQLSLSSAASTDEFFCDKRHADAVLKNLYNYFQSQNSCDVTLIAGGCRITAHKIILSSSSEYFAVMFTGSLKEAQPEATEITLERVDPQALQDLVNYCYTGTIDLREETVEVLLSTASLLQFNSVSKACCTFLNKQLDPCNCLGIAMFAELLSCLDLYKSALKYTYQHFMQVVKHQEFLALTEEQLASLLELDDLNVVTEENVFESLMTWVQHDSANREPYLSTLLKLIKLP